jgi:hypothetical protein
MRWFAGGRTLGRMAFLAGAFAKKEEGDVPVRRSLPAILVARVARVNNLLVIALRTLPRGRAKSDPAPATTPSCA